MTNYYHILGLQENATQQEIKAAFKKLAVQFHPDKHSGNLEMEDKFKEINEAYQILSNEYEKARYDLKLNYQYFSQTTTHQNPYSYPRRQQRRTYYRPTQVDYRKNTIATLYAFGITFCIALIVMIGFWIKQSYDQMKYEQLLAERRAIYEEAKTSFDQGQYENAFGLMASLSFFKIEEEDIRDFKESMVDYVASEGNYYFENHNYHGAIDLYELIQKFEPDKPFFRLKLRLAESYKRTNNPEKSISIYEELMLREYRIIASMVEIAKIRRDYLNDNQSAMDYYLNAHKEAVKMYKSYYGQGYPLVINQRNIPADHYELYKGLADIYLRLDDPTMAIKAADWNKYVWPDSTHAYLTSAHAYMVQNQLEDACEEYVGARNRGWLGIPPINCN